MSTTRDLNYRLYLHKVTGFCRTAFQSEFEKYMAIQSGDIEKTKNNLQTTKSNFLSGKGQLSDDPLRNMIYHFVVSAAMVARICVEGGMEHDTAYTLSDIYIHRADTSSSCEEILALFEQMHLDFAGRMREIRKNDIISLHIRRTIDYIYEHLQEKLTVKRLAEVAGLNVSYLSKLFMKETGTSLKTFITNARLDTAENMLKFSEFSYLDISLALGFSSQSAFISVFRQHRGMTPKAFRNLHAADGTLTSVTQKQ